MKNSPLPATPGEMVFIQCLEDLQTLRRSAMFALSRGSKELFHTNFLAFVLEIDSASLDEADRCLVQKIQRAVLSRLFGNPAPEKVATWREARRLDLVVASLPAVDDDGRPTLGGHAVLGDKPKQLKKTKMPTGLPTSLVVIEAKLKALPDAEQLRDYNTMLQAGSLALAVDPEIELPDNAESPTWGSLRITLNDAKTGAISLRAYPPERNTDNSENSENSEKSEKSAHRFCFAAGLGRMRRVLLAPADPEGASSDADWDFLCWSKLLDDFDSGSEKTKQEGAVSAMLHDYASSTRALLSVLEKVSDFVRREYAGTGKNLKLRTLSTIPNYFRSLRVHDVVGKYIFSVLQAELSRSLDAASSDLPKIICVQLVEQGLQPIRWERSTQIFMTRGKPGLCIEYRLRTGTGRTVREVCIGVQVQGTEYRHYVSASHPSKATKDQPLQSLANLLKGNPLASDWWSSINMGHMPSSLRKFDAEGFLYVREDAAMWTYEMLKENVAQSLKRAVRHVKAVDFTKAACNLIHNRGGVIS